MIDVILSSTSGFSGNQVRMIRTANFGCDIDADTDNEGINLASKSLVLPTEGGLESEEA